MAKPTNEERAQQLVLRITQLHSFLQVSQLVKTARFGQQYVFPDAQAIDRAEAFVTAELLAKLFSLFDRNGTDLRAFSAEDPNLAEEIASMTLEWRTLEAPLTLIRHQFSAHSARTPAGTARAVAAFGELGTDGLEAAFRLIERMFQLVPWLAAAAKGKLPSLNDAARSAFREALTARQELNGRILDVRRAFGDENECTQRLALADDAARDLKTRWEAFRASAASTEGTESFLQLWDPQVQQLLSAVESLRTVRETLNRARALTGQTAGQVPDALGSLRRAASAIAASFRMKRVSTVRSQALSENQRAALEKAELALNDVVTALSDATPQNT